MAAARRRAENRLPFAPGLDMTASTTPSMPDGSDQALHQERQARWMGAAAFAVVLLASWLLQ
jgi:hypothetical protein